MRLTGHVYVTEEARPAPSHNETTRKRSDSGGSGSSSSSSSSGGGFVFVRQEDLFYSQLTVRETLLFTARLRMPRGVKDAEKREYVERMLSRMGLLEVGGWVGGWVGFYWGDWGEMGVCVYVGKCVGDGMVVDDT
jgi:ABC-type multidrug transport system ATPase subunit